VNGRWFPDDVVRADDVDDWKVFVFDVIDARKVPNEQERVCA
jgi:hypothetical protein